VNHAHTQNQHQNTFFSSAKPIFVAYEYIVFELTYKRRTFDVLCNHGYAGSRLSLLQFVKRKKALDTKANN